MKNDLITNDPVKDAIRHSNREMPVIGKCEYCNEDILSWETHYNVEGLLLHDDCAINWLAQFREFGD